MSGFTQFGPLNLPTSYRLPLGYIEVPRAPVQTYGGAQCPSKVLTRLIADRRLSLSLCDQKEIFCSGGNVAGLSIEEAMVVAVTRNASAIRSFKEVRTCESAVVLPFLNL